MENVTHEQIYERLCALETKVDEIDNNTKSLVDIMNSFQGAFKVMGWIGQAAKPILWVAALLGSITFIEQWRK